MNVNGLNLPKEKLAEWAFRAGLVACFFYFQANFVSIKDYKQDVGRKTEVEEARANTLNNINLVLARIDERSKSDDTKSRLEKLEAQVHELERKVP